MQAEMRRAFVAGGALHSAIVSALREYGAVPEHYLARLLGREAEDIRLAVETLERERVVSREGETVSLSRDGQPPAM